MSMTDHFNWMKNAGHVTRKTNRPAGRAAPPSSPEASLTQVPNLILRGPNIGLGAKLAYSLFLHFAWNNDSCFPSQDRLAGHMGMSVSRVNEYIKELEAAGLIEITRRGRGKTNLYKVNFVVKGKRKPASASPSVPARRSVDRRKKSVQRSRGTVILELWK